MRDFIQRLLMDGERTRDRVADVVLVVGLILLALNLLNAYLYG